ncbi:Chaperone protein HtpG [Buchnera aphidicola (Thelaxes suberi)]|uniref:molecular chaperone HtpG n=1 Tax=Buchnera aphidicola TaxID=9 RepID=UPI00346475D0
MNNMNKEIHQFQSETKQVLHLMIHSLYSNKEIFLRELIANASDALDKLRFLSNTNPNFHSYNKNLSIKISISKKDNTIIISDNGIGMNKEEVIENLGTIAKSGTKKFLSSIEQNYQNNKPNQIGQFGVGFYSSFIVANFVSVHTRSVYNTEKEGIFWTSHGTGEFSIEKKEKKEIGTTIYLTIKNENKEFLELWKVKNIIHKYSEYVSFPIQINNEKKEWEQINNVQAIWLQNKSEISEKKYIEFYKNITKDDHAPLTWIHNKVEGNQEYTLLLYIPSKLPMNIWNKDNKYGIKLYIQKIFIMEDVDKILPNYLRFIKGVVDCNDLPLNISREILQENKIINILKKSITKKILNILTFMSEKEPEKYTMFWKEFGSIFKEGPAEDISNKNAILNLLRFNSTNDNNKDKFISLEEYTSNMDKNQKNIYFISGDNFTAAQNSPHLELFKKNKINVLLLSEKVDEWMVNYITDFKGIKLQSITKYDPSLNKIFKEKVEVDKIDDSIHELIKKIKLILKNEVIDVKLTCKLTNTPAVLTPDSNEMSTQMAKLFLSAGQNVPAIKYILEINPIHPLIKKISRMNQEEEIKNWIEILFDQTVLIEKGSLENPNNFIQKINKILSI